MTTNRPTARLLICVPLFGVAALLSSAVNAQEAAGRSLTVVPTFTVHQTFTDNIDLVSAGERSESVTELRPGIRLNARSGRVQGSLDYSLGALLHARDGSRNTLQNTLNANLASELVEQRVFINASANISQQTISAFGTQTGDTGFVNDNRTEVATFRVAPSLRSALGGWADLVAQADWSASNAVSTDQGDSSGISASLGLSKSLGVYGWGLNGSWQRDNFDAGEQTNRDSVFASVNFTPEPELQLSLRGGIEGEDFTGNERTNSDFWGWGATWRPSERTSLGLQSDRRYFGRSHSFNFQHRMARSIWSYTDSRGVNDNRGGGDSLYGTQGGSQNPAVPTYDQILARLTVQFPGLSSSQREELARSILNDLAGAGGFLRTGLSLERNQNLSVALLGLRQTLTLAGFKSESEQLSGTGGSGSDLTKVGRVRQSGYSLTVSHRLTPMASLALSASHTRTLGELAQPGNEQQSLSLFWTGQISLRTNASLGVRHTQSESDTSPYTESAVVGSISLQF